MTAEQNTRYRNILIEPINECAHYSPKFGYGRNGGFSLAEFQTLYGVDEFYKWLGLDNTLMCSAHKATGGITTVYRQIGIGCERFVRAIFMDFLASMLTKLRGLTKLLELTERNVHFPWVVEL